MPNDYYDENELRTMGFKSVGIDVRVSKYAIIKYPNEVSIGNHVAIDSFVYISVRMDIGNRVHIPPFTGISGGKKSYCCFEDYTFCSEGCKIICGSDDYVGIGLPNPMIPEKFRVPVIYGEIIFKKFSGIGANVTVFPNVTIGEGTLVGACSLVTKSLEPWGIYRGIPAQRMKERQKDAILNLVKELVEIDNPIDLIIICSVTVQECFDRLLKKSLEIIGVPYKLILTDPNLSISESYNSILQTNMDDVKHSKYLLFIAQDVSIQDVNWGQKLIEVCDSLPDFGYGGIECRKEKEAIGYYHAGKTNDPPIEVTTCDGAFAIIPSKLFLEHQFDEQFPWYPVMDDYQCWIRLVKHLKVYHISVKDYGTHGCSIPSKWVSQFANNIEYINRLREDHDKLLKKWNLQELITTTWG